MRFSVCEINLAELERVAKEATLTTENHMPSFRRAVSPDVVLRLIDCIREQTNLQDRIAHGITDEPVPKESV